MKKEEKSLVMGVRFNKTLIQKMDRVVRTLGKRGVVMTRNKLITQAVITFLLERDREML